VTNLLTTMPPHNDVAERAILGLIIINSKKIAGAEILTPPDFYSTKHQEIFATILELRDKKEPIDAVTINAHLKGRVSTSYLSSLMDGLPKGTNLDTYVRYVKDAALCREAVAKAAQVIERGQRGNYEDTLDSIRELASMVGSDSGGTMVQKVLDFIDATDGDFSVTQVYNLRHPATTADKSNIRQVLSRLKRDGIIAKAGNRDGVYRKIEVESEYLNWTTASEDEHPIALPLGLSQIIKVLPRSILCIAGTPNSGKTAMCLEAIRLNMDRMKVRYFSSELGAEKLRARLKLFDNVDFPAGWKFEPYYRSSNFPDAIRPYPDDLSIIDFIEVSSDAFILGDILKGIFDNLKNGVALVAIQKKFGSDFGRGAEFGLEKPSLYIALERGWIKIVKAKEWRDGVDNPNGKIRPFALRHGAELETTNEWQYPEDYDVGKIEHPWSPKSLTKGTKFLR
jgi:hypothetical protein